MEFAKVSAITFASVLAADILDKGTLLVGLLAIRRSPSAVFLGSAAAMLASCAVWIFVGHLVEPLFRTRWAHWAVGAVLIASGLGVALLEPRS